jgi:hypothetical protein
LLLILLIAANYFAPFADLDFTWQVRTGEEIVRTKQLRPLESFSYTINGRQVPDFEWLYEVILWSAWTTFGFGGLKLLRVLLVFTPLLLVGLRLRKEGVRWYGIALSLLVAILVLSSCWNLRPLFCTTIGLLLVAGWLHDHCTGRVRLTWWLPVVMLLWANLHPGVIAGQALILGAVVCEWANRALRINPPLGSEACRRLTVIGLAGLLATLISPDPIGRLLYPFRPELAHPIQRIFVEMTPAYLVIARTPFTILPVYLIALAVGLTVFLRFRSYRLWEVALLVAVTALANLAVRGLQDWLLITLMLGVPQLSAMIRQIRVKLCESGRSEAQGIVSWFLHVNRRCERLVYSRALRFQWTWPLTAIGVLSVLSVIPPLARRMPIQDSKDWPVGALDWIADHRLEGRFFAIPDFGSYLGWRLGPRALVYVDTRGFFFPPELIEDSHYLPQMAPGWEPRLERVLSQGTDYFLLQTTGSRGELWRAVRPQIGRPLYLDDQAVLLSRAQLVQALPNIEAALHADLRH